MAYNHQSLLFFVLFLKKSRLHFISHGYRTVRNGGKKYTSCVSYYVGNNLFLSSLFPNQTCTTQTDDFRSFLLLLWVLIDVVLGMKSYCADKSFPFVPR